MPTDATTDAKGDNQPQANFHLDPDSDIRTARQHGIVVIHFLATSGQDPITLDPVLAGMVLRVAARSLPKRKLPEGFSLATFSWSAVCVLAQFRLGGALAVRAIEQNQVLPIPEAQATLLSFVEAKRPGSLEPFTLGRALSTCVRDLGTGASDIYDVARPLRRVGEVSGMLVSA